jgi:putative membrane protein
MRARRVRTYYKILLAVFAVVWTWAAIAPLDRGAWVLENLLVVVFVPLFLVAARYFRLSDLSYGLVTLFAVLHVVGSHYTYAEVPFGFTLQRWLGADRNMYDRLVHFTFGLLLALPIREILVVLADFRGFWSYYLPLDLTLSLSAVYEILEWVAVQVAEPGAGLAFLGTQGDEWDTQKDMALAASGALIAMVIAALFLRSYKSGGRGVAKVKTVASPPGG